MSPKDSEITNTMKTGGEILVESLRINGVDKVFCVPGESYLAALDAFHDTPEIQLVVCRQERGGAMTNWPKSTPTLPDVLNPGSPGRSPATRASASA